MSRRGRSSSPISLFAFQDIITSVTAIIILITLLLTVELLSRKQGRPAVSTAAAAEALQQAVSDAQVEAEHLEAQLASGEKAAQNLATSTPAQLKREAAELSQQAERLETELAGLKSQSDAAASAEQTVVAQLYDREEDRAKLDRLRSETKAKQEQLDEVKQQNRLVFNVPHSKSRTAWLIDLSGKQIKASRFSQSAGATIYDGSDGTEKFLRWVDEQDKVESYFVLMVRPSAIDIFDELKEKLTSRGIVIGFDLIAEDQTVVHSGGESAP